MLVGLIHDFMYMNWLFLKTTLLKGMVMLYVSEEALVITDAPSCFS